MRIALIADIHGNLVTLESVLGEIAREEIDQIVCLGDVGAMGPQPHEVLARLRQLDCPVVLGNTDAWLLSPRETDPEKMGVVDAITLWCAEQLSPEDKAYLQTFAPVLEMPLDEGRTLLGYHGSPRSYDDVIAAATPDADVERMLAGHSGTIMVGGHTHVQMVRRYGNAHLVNVGSVGLAGITAGTPELPPNRQVRWAEYGVLTIEPGRLSIDLRRTPLDLDAVLQAGIASGMPHVEWWLQTWNRS